MLVGIVDVKHVNPVQPKPSQALLDRSHDPVVGEVIGGIDGRYALVCLAWLRWGVRPEKAPDLGREDELFTGLRSQHRAQALLGEAVAVEGRGVKETYACLPGGLDHAMRFIVGHLFERAIVVVALDVVKQVEAVAKDHVLADADPLDRLQHVGPHRPVVLLVALLGARFESRMEADLHQAEWPARSWPRSQRSPLAMCAVAVARASSGSPEMSAS